MIGAKSQKTAKTPPQNEKTNKTPPQNEKTAMASQERLTSHTLIATINQIPILFCPEYRDRDLSMVPLKKFRCHTFKIY